MKNIDGKPEHVRAAEQRTQINAALGQLILNPIRDSRKIRLAIHKPLGPYYIDDLSTQIMCFTAKIAETFELDGFTVMPGTWRYEQREEVTAIVCDLLLETTCPSDLIVAITRYCHHADEKVKITAEEIS